MGDNYSTVGASLSRSHSKTSERGFEPGKFEIRVEVPVQHLGQKLIFCRPKADNKAAVTDRFCYLKEGLEPIPQTRNPDYHLSLRKPPVLKLIVSIMNIPLSKIAYARSGDKGDGSNVGVVAYNAEIYEILKEKLTTDRVKQHFKEICFGDVDRYEAPNLLALNFILHDSLGGGGSESLKTDAQGKTHGLGILFMEIEVPDDLKIPAGN